MNPCEQQCEKILHYLLVDKRTLSNQAVIKHEGVLLIMACKSIFYLLYLKKKRQRNVSSYFYLVLSPTGFTLGWTKAWEFVKAKGAALTGFTT